MEPWTWLVGYLFVLVVLQLVFTRVIRARSDGGGDADESHGGASLGAFPETGGDAETDPAVGPGGDGPPEGDRRCPRCGAQNEWDAAYTFCWRCLERIG